MANAEDTPVDPDEITEAQQVDETEDPANLQSAEDLDEDRIGVDPLEEGVEPAERWSEPTAEAVTPGDQPETLEERLHEERPERGARTAPAPAGEIPVDELDETVDYRAERENAEGQPGKNEHGTVLRGEAEDPDGLAANTGEGEREAERSPQPEEEAERVEGNS